nr:hypothetical protein [Acidipropionibacterium jensenii]
MSGPTPAVKRLVRDDIAHLADPIAQIQRIELGLVERLAPVLGPGQLEAGVEDRGQRVQCYGVLLETTQPVVSELGRGEAVLSTLGHGLLPGLHPSEMS